MEETDIQGPRDLSLIMKPDGVVEVDIVEAKEMVEPDNPEMSKFKNDIDFNPQQRVELQVLLQKWTKVFATNEEDFGRKNLVRHNIHTGDAAPIKKR